MGADTAMQEDLRTVLERRHPFKSIAERCPQADAAPAEIVERTPLGGLDCGIVPQRAADRRVRPAGAHVLPQCVPQRNGL